MFDKLLGSKRKPNKTQSVPVEAPRLISVYDQQGNRHEMPLAEWRAQLQQQLLDAETQQNADRLYQVILWALEESLFEDIEQASISLLKLDSNRERSHCVRALVLLGSERTEQAGALLDEAIAQLGESCALLTNRAKANLAKQQAKQAQARLWRGLQLDPNFFKCLDMWLELAAADSDEAGRLAALHKVAQLPGSWRAQLWLAEHHLIHAQLPEAISLYRSLLSHPLLDPELLTHISADLGRNGHPALIAELLAPIYDPNAHPPQTGLNLLQSYLDTEQPNAGMALTKQLYRLDNASLNQRLDEFVDAFQALKLRLQPAAEAPTSTAVQMMQFNRPVWHYGLHNPSWLFQAKAPNSPKILLTSFGKATADADSGQQREDDLGRLTRALPLYLAESIHYWSDYQSDTLIPAIAGHGPVLFSADTDLPDWLDHYADEYDYFICGKVAQGTQDTLAVECQLWDLRQRQLLFTQALTLSQQDASELRLLEKRLLTQIGRVRTHAFDDFYQPPSLEALPIHLSYLGQALILSLTDNELLPKESLWGERNLLEWPWRMTQQWPQALAPKIMFLSGLGKAAGYQSELLAGFEMRAFDTVRQLRQASCKAAWLAPLLEHIYLRPTTRTEATSAPKDYQHWCDNLADNPG